MSGTNNLSKRINSFIKKHKLERTRKIVAIGLALIVATSVFSYLIIPAISTTESPDGINTLSSANTDERYTKIIQAYEAAADSDITSIDDKITSASFTKDQVQDDGSIKGSFKIEYNEETEAATKYLRFKLDEKISVIPDEGVYTQVTDIVDGKSEVVGGAIVTPEGWVIIEIKDEFLKNYENGFKGAIDFDATVSRDKSESGDRTTIDIGGQELTIDGFTERKMALEKTGVDAKDGTITWTVVIDNPQIASYEVRRDADGNIINGADGNPLYDVTYTPNDLNGYTVSDTMFASGLLEGSVTCEPAAGSFADGKFTFGSGSTETQYKLTYKTKLTDDQLKGIDENTTYNQSTGNGSVTNEASVNKEGETDGPGDSSTVEFELGYKLTKTGKLDYSDPADPKIEWTLTVNNKLNRSVDDLYIEDSMFPTDIEDIIFDPADSVTGTIENGKLTFASTDENNKYTGDVTVKFITSVNSVPDGNKDWDGSVKNTAKLPNQPGVSKSVKTIPLTVYKGGNKGGVDYKFNEWKIALENISIENADLNGYTIEDASFKELVDVKTAMSNWWAVNDYDANGIKMYINGNLVKDGTGYYDIDKETGVITLKNLESYGSQINKIEFFYYTEPSEDITQDSYEFTDKNEVSVKDNGTEIGSGSSSIDWKKDPQTTTEEPTPVINKSKYTNGSMTVDEDTKTASMPWKITVSSLNNATYAGVLINDTMSVIDSNYQEFTADGIYHYMTPTQLNALEVKTNEGDTLTKGTDYTVETTTDDSGNIISFVLTFSEDFTSDSSWIEITYNTTADISGVEAGTKIKFKNAIDSGSAEFDYEKIDKSKEPYAKYDASVEITNQSGTTSHKISSLQTVTIDGIEYYKFDYQIDVNKNGAKYDSIYTLYDKLPTGFKLYNDTIGVNYGGWINNIKLVDGKYGNTWDDFIFTLSDNELTIQNNKNPSTAMTFTYSLITEKEAFDNRIDQEGSVDIRNTLRDNQEHKEISQTQTVEKEFLEKKSIGDHDKNFVTYQVSINPERKDISSGDTIYLEDIIKAAGDDPAAIMVTLQSLKIYDVQPDGTRVLLDTSQYQYVLDNNPQPDVQICETTVSDPYASGDGAVIKISGITAGSGGSFTLKNSASDKFWGWVGIGDEGNQSVVGWTDVGDGGFVGSGDLTVSVTAEQTKNGGDIYIVYNKNYMDSITVENVSFSSESVYPYAAKMGLTVPDGKYLQIEYQYLCSLREGGDSDGVKLVNTVTVDSSLAADETAEDEKTIKIDSSNSAEITSNPKGTYTLKKVDVGDYSATLSAGFNLYKWDADSSAWLPLIGIEERTDDNGTKYWLPRYGGSTDNSESFTVPGDGYLIKLDSEKFYKIVEVDPPDGYSDENANHTEYFYTNSQIPSEIPTDVERAKITPLTDGGKLYIKNYKEIAVSAKKNWVDGTDKHSDEHVTFTLYRSHTKSAAMPKDAQAYDVSKIANADNNWTVTWNDLPSGDENGKPWYYYVAETAVNGDSELDGNTPFYSGNGTNKSSTIYVTNTSGLTVQKLWRRKDESPGDPTVKEIRFRIYRSLTKNLDEDSLSGGEYLDDAALSAAGVTSEDGWITLDSSNNWMVTLTGLAPHADGDATKLYYYYVVEDTTELTDNIVSYQNNGTGSTGLITINNRSTKITVGQMPSTGSVGTAMFFIAGGALAICSLGAIRITRRRNSDRS